MDNNQYQKGHASSRRIHYLIDKETGRTVPTSLPIAHAVNPEARPGVKAGNPLLDDLNNQLQSEGSLKKMKCLYKKEWTSLHTRLGLVRNGNIYKVGKTHLTNMVSMNITRMSSKGQIVIPSEMREDIKEGEELLILKDENRIILKKVDKISEEMREDLEFAKRTEEAWQQIEKGESTSYSKEDFLKRLKGQ